MKKIIPLIMLAVSASFAVKIGVMTPVSDYANVNQGVCRSVGGSSRV